MIPADRFSIKIRNILLILLLGVGLVACSRHSEFRQRLTKAEALMVERPDSAYEMLCDMEGQAEEMSRALRMKYWLLRCNAQNNAGVLFTSDSISSLLVEYYDRHGTPNERMLAHYMQGCAHRDMREWPKEAHCYNDAVAAADSAAADCDFRQLSIIYKEIGYIYSTKYLIKEALQAYDNAERYAQDTSSLLSIWYHKSNALIRKGDIDEGLRIKEELIAHDMAKGLYKSTAVTKGACVSYYIKKGNFKKAKAYLDDYAKHSDKLPGLGDYYYKKGTYYEETEDLDSAEYYYRKLQRLNDELLDQYLASRGLTRIYNTREQQDSLGKYALRALLLTDSLYNRKVGWNIQAAQTMYDYSRHQVETQRKVQKIQEGELRLRNIIIGATVICFIIILLALLYRNRVRQRMHKIHLQQVRNSAVVETLTKEVEEKTRLISLLHEQMNANAIDLQESEQMRRTIHILEQQTQEHKQQIDAFTKSQHATHLHEEPTIATFIQKVKRAKEHPNAEEWQRVFMLVETHYPGMKEIKNRKDVSPQEYRICVLLKLGLDIQSIVLLENSSNVNVSAIRRRLLKKLFGVEGGTKDFDRRLAEVL